MKLFIILALVAVASADLRLRRGYGGSSFGLGGGLGYGGWGGSGSYLSGGLSSLGGYYGSGLSGGYGLSGLSGYGVGLGSSYGGLGLSSGLALGGSYGSYGGSYGGQIPAAVLSTRNVQVVDVGSTGGVAAPASIVIGPSIQPLDIEFQSQSSPVNVRQSHIGGVAAAPQVSSHTEDADILRQEIVKPVIHEVTEAIQPYRTITQEVRPVLETVNQLITRGDQRQTGVIGGYRNVGVGLSGGYSGLSGGYSGRTGYSGGYSSGLGSLGLSNVGGLIGGAGLSTGLRSSYGGLSLGSGYRSGLSSLGGGYSSGLSSLGGGYNSGSSLRSGYSVGTHLVNPSISTDNYRS